MPNIVDMRAFLADEHGLAVVSTSRADGAVLSSVVNAGVMQHPVSGETVAAFVSGGSAGRLSHIRAGRPVTLVARRDWRWIGVTGSADLIGPDDLRDGYDPDAVPMLLRDVFTAAGGTHDDWDEYDRAMLDDRRVAVFVRPARVVGNG